MAWDDFASRAERMLWQLWSKVNAEERGGEKDGEKKDADTLSKLRMVNSTKFNRHPEGKCSLQSL